MVAQCFVQATEDLLNDPKRALFVLKKTAANEAAKIPGLPFYVCSHSSRVERDAHMPWLVALFFPDL